MIFMSSTRSRLSTLGHGLLLSLLALPLAAQAGRAYVSNEDGHTVTVIDTDKNAVVGTVPVGKRPRGIQLSHDGKTLFVALSGLPKCPPSVPDEECEKLERDVKADGVAAVDTETLKVTKVHQAGSDPEQFDLIHGWPPVRGERRRRDRNGARHEAPAPSSRACRWARSRKAYACRRTARGCS